MRTIFKYLCYGIVMWILALDLCTAQQKAMFEHPVYFEDGLGNRDTIIIGGDTTASQGLNPEFGEVPVVTPFDSVFEVRAIYEQEFWKPNPILLKKIIGWTEKVFNYPEPCENIEYFRFVIHINHLPLKISWDSKLYADSLCILSSYFTSGKLAMVIGPWTLDLNPENENLAYCVAQYDSVILDIGQGMYIGNLYDEFIYEVQGGTFDTMLILQWDFDYSRSSLACGNIVSTQNIKPDNAPFSVYPVPATDQLFIEWEGNVIKADQLRIINAHGQTMDTNHLTPDLVNGYISIDTFSWPLGIYFVQLIARGRPYTQKIIKI